MQCAVVEEGIGSPADAGIGLGVSSGGLSPEWFPRGRGDRPGKEGRAALALMVPPRTRG